jgi:hypothetical protein
MNPAVRGGPGLFPADEISQNNLCEVDSEIFQNLSLFLTRLNGDFR